MIIDALTKQTILEAQSGNRDAFEKLYNQFYREVFSLARYILRSDSKAEDVLQETFLKVFHKLPDLKSPEAFSSWIYMITQNECKMLMRKRDEKTLYYDTQDAEYIQIADTDPVLPVSSLELNEDRLFIRSEIEKLPISQRTVIVYFYYLNMSVKEISTILACNENTVKSRLFSGRGMLKKSIEAFQKQLGTKLAFSMVPLSQVLAQNTLHYSISGNAAKAIFLSLSRQIGIGAGPFGFLWKVRDFIKKAVRKTGVAAAIVLLLLLLCGSVTATVLFKHGAFDFSGKYSGSADQAAAVVLTPAAARPTQNSPSTDSSQGSSSSTGSDNQSAGSNSGQESTSFDSTDISMRAETDVLSATVSPDHAKTPGSGTSDVPGPEASGTVTPTTEPTITPMVTPTIMPTLTVTPTLTPAPVIILPIVTPTPAPTDTPTATPTPTPTDTPTATPTPTPTGIEEQTAASVAAQIADIVSPLPGDVYLTLPSVPEGYSIAIQSSGNTGAIALDGKITLAGTEQTVTVVLMVTKSADNTTAETTGIDVVLPRMLRTNADLGITSTEGSTLSGVLIKEDTSISHQDGKTQANQTLLIVSIAAEDKTSAVLIPVTDHATVYAVAASNDAGAGGTKSGDYVPVDTNTFNVKSQHYLWIKVISEDLSTTRYYSLLVQ